MSMSLDRMRIDSCLMVELIATLVRDRKDRCSDNLLTRLGVVG